MSTSSATEKKESALVNIRKDVRVVKIPLTRFINTFKEKDRDVTPVTYFQELLGKITTKFNTLQELQSSVYREIMNLSSVGEDTVEAELEQQERSDYEYNEPVADTIAELTLLINQMTKAQSCSANQNASASSPSVQLKLPELKIQYFADNVGDPFDFFRFKTSFENAMNSIEGITPAIKIVYLRSYLRGRALSLVENMPVDDGSFDSAWQLLENEFLDKNHLITTTLNSILTWPVCTSLEKNSDFLIFLKSKLTDLNHFHLNFFDEDTSGSILLATIVRNKLYEPFLREIARKVNSNYPQVRTIMDHMSSVTKLLKPVAKESQAPRAVQDIKLSTGLASTHPSNATAARNGGALLPPKPSYVKGDAKGCKFCFLTNHSSLHCKKYCNHQVRKVRAEELKLCVRCLSPKHTESNCLGKRAQLPFSCKSCHSTCHSTPLCPDMVLSLSSAKSLRDDGDRK